MANDQSPMLPFTFLATFTLTILSGCGGGGISTFLIGSDSRVEWVFEAPTQWGDGMLGSGLAFGRVNAAAVTDDGNAIVVLTNYGGSWGWIERCNAYLLDIQNGQTIHKAQGPYDTRDDWYLDRKTAYVEGTEDEQGYWFALDLQKSAAFRHSKIVYTVWGQRQPPEGKKCESFIGGSHYGMGPLLPAPLFPFFLIPRGDPPYNDRIDAGNGRELVFSGRAIDLVCADANGLKRTFFLGHLAKIEKPNIVVNDNRRLIFASGSYLICVDMRGLPAQQRTTTQPVDSNNEVTPPASQAATETAPKR